VAKQYLKGFKSVAILAKISPDVVHCSISSRARQMRDQRNSKFNIVGAIFIAIENDE